MKKESTGKGPDWLLFGLASILGGMGGILLLILGQSFRWPGLTATSGYWLAPNSMLYAVGNPEARFIVMGLYFVYGSILGVAVASSLRVVFQMGAWLVHWAKKMIR